MLYDNKILSTLNAVAKPLTLKQSLSKWGNDPLWHKLVSDGYIQYYPHAVTVTSIAKKWLKERELHRWVLEQRLKETENKEECREISEYARLAHFSDIKKAAYEKATAGDYEKLFRQMDADEGLRNCSTDLPEQDSFVVDEHYESLDEASIYAELEEMLSVE
jgi:hypothetical protein